MSEKRVLLAFHGQQAIKDKYLARVREHRAADQLKKGQYWQEDPDGVFRGCAVACTLHSNNHAEYETELGIPQLLARLEDGIFEGLPQERTMSWPEEFLSAPEPGADLSLVWPQFAVWLLTNPDHGVLRLAKSKPAKASIQAVADAYTRVVGGETIPVAEWREIYKKAAAEASASYAAAAFPAVNPVPGPASVLFAATLAAVVSYAAAAAYAAAGDAAAAREKARVAQADKLLALMAAAPVREHVPA